MFLKNQETERNLLSHPKSSAVVRMWIPIGQSMAVHMCSLGGETKLDCYFNALEAISTQRVSITIVLKESQSQNEGAISGVSGSRAECRNKHIHVLTNVRSSSVKQTGKWSEFLHPFFDSLFSKSLPCSIEYIVISFQFHSGLCLKYHCFLLTDLQCLSVQAINKRLSHKFYFLASFIDWMNHLNTCSI